MKKIEEKEFVYLLDEDTGERIKLVKVNPYKTPCFCPQCKLIRGQDISPTFLRDWEEVYYNSWGMCRQCLDFLNKHRERFDELSGNIVINDGKVSVVKRSED